MKSYELKPTQENLLSTLLKDTIGRNLDVYSFAEILNLNRIDLENIKVINRFLHMHHRQISQARSLCLSLLNI